MASNILVTGAAGYIGGSIVADFLTTNVVKKENIIAAVRSEEQVKSLSKLGITVLQLDLTDESAVVESLLKHNVNIVINTASSLDPALACNLINALSKQREVSGKETYILHSSGLGAFYESAGWPAGEFNDTGPLFEIEKRLAESSPIRKTDVEVIEHAKARSVTSFIVVPSTVYGQGTGEWNKLSVILPLTVKASLSQKKVSKFSQDSRLSAVHISDMTALYAQIVKKVLRKEVIPSNEEGYYFAIAHHFQMWELSERLAEALKARNLAADSKTYIWPSVEAAAEAMGVPTPFAYVWTLGDNIIAERGRSIGWNPAWNEDRLLQNIDDEIDAVVEHGKAKSSLIDTLFASFK